MRKVESEASREMRLVKKHFEIARRGEAHEYEAGLNTRIRFLNREIKRHRDGIRHLRGKLGK